MGIIDEVRETAGPIVSLGGGFMLDGATTERGAAFGLDFGEYYALGRGGVLGDVDASVVADAFVVFAPEVVTMMWNAARLLREPDAAAQSYSQACQDWGRVHFAHAENLDEISSALGKIVNAATTTDAPLFSGWRTLPLPSDTPALVAQQLHVLRELRGGLHGVALKAAGLTPLEAVMVHSPAMAPMFGWADGDLATPTTKAAHAKAEQITDELVAPAYEVLDEAERARLVVLLNDLVAATT